MNELIITLSHKTHTDSETFGLLRFSIGNILSL